MTSIPEDDTTPVPIGRAAPDCSVYVLDEEGRPVATGKVGELWVSGPALMMGYWRLPQATADALKMIEPAPGISAMACRTGDLARQRADGNLEFVGRADQQVKVRGFRVELGEVEATLSRHPAVAQAASLVAPDEAGGSRLVAVVVLGEGMTAKESELRRHCAATLAPHMVPERIEFRSSLPLTSTGKLDRRIQLAREAKQGGQ